MDSDVFRLRLPPSEPRRLAALPLASAIRDINQPPKM
jgi:hypothetical protein